MERKRISADLFASGEGAGRSTPRANLDLMISLLSIGSF